MNVHPGIVFIRHGFNSNAKNMSVLANWLQSYFAGWQCNNESYEWRGSVLAHGIAFAGDVLGEIEKASDKELEKLVLVGHSQGGLLGRVAAATIMEPDQLEKSLQKGRSIDRPYLQEARNALQELRRKFSRVWPNCTKKLFGVVMIATPNSGAFTYGQLSLLARLTADLGRWALGSRLQDVSELQTDRLFRVLQNVQVKHVKYASISGSAVNRYSRFLHSDLGEVPYLGRLGLHLDLPNDWVVEDCSVDLEQAPLPCEIADLSSQYQHIRAYRDCLDMTHTGIHGREEFYEVLAGVFAGWGL